MGKITRIAGVALIISALCAGTAWADGYTAQTKTQVIDQLKHFYEAEKGNRLTAYSMNTLIELVEKKFSANTVIRTGEKGAENQRRKTNDKKIPEQKNP